MTWTFNPSLSSTRDRIRQRVGDTDVARQEVQDETIDAYLGLETGWLQVAYRCALDLAAKYSRIVQVTVDHQTTRGEQISDNYRKLAADILREIQSLPGSGAEATTCGIFVGGLTDCRGPYDVEILETQDLPDYC